MHDAVCVGVAAGYAAVFAVVVLTTVDDIDWVGRVSASAAIVAAVVHCAAAAAHSSKAVAAAAVIYIISAYTCFVAASMHDGDGTVLYLLFVGSAFGGVLAMFGVGSDDGPLDAKGDLG